MRYCPFRHYRRAIYKKILIILIIIMCLFYLGSLIEKLINIFTRTLRQIDALLLRINVSKSTL